MTQNRTKMILAVVLLLAGLAVVAAQAQTSGATAVAPPAAAQATDSFHNPAPWLEMGADIRWRWVYGWNIDTVRDRSEALSEWHFTRNRFRWWTKSKLDEDIAFNTRMTWEFRTWENPERKPQHVDFDEVLFDNFNLSLKNMFDLPLTGVFGRQDIMLGKGWLVMDATPLDGSRTFFFDAARFTYDWQETNTKIDMIYIDMAAQSDRWLKPFNDRDRLFTEQDEHGAILYLTNKSIPNTQIEGYFMYRNDNPVDSVEISSAVNPVNPAWIKKARLYTFGGALDGKIDENWRYRAEGAYQFGEKSSPGDTTYDLHDLRAFGTKDQLDYDFNDERKNNLHAGYEFLTGDKQGTDDIEAFDPLWGEWPQWSEMYVYTYSLEGAIGETTNLQRIWFGHQFNICPKAQLSTDYHLLYADESVSGSRFSNDGSFRGHLLTAWLRWTFNKNLKGHLLAEYLWPGGFYADNNRDDAYFLRINIEYTF